MSQMMTLKIPFNSAEDIKKVLDHFGLKYTESEEGEEIRGYRGAMSRMKGNIVVPMEAFGGTADMGFIKQEDGSWQIHCESVDRDYMVQIQNAHLYLKVEAATKRKKRKMKVVSGSVPSRMERNAGRKQEIQLEISA
jgi:hypothetical protein